VDWAADAIATSKRGTTVASLAARRLARKRAIDRKELFAPVYQAMRVAFGKGDLAEFIDWDGCSIEWAASDPRRVLPGGTRCSRSLPVCAANTDEAPPGRRCCGPPHKPLIGPANGPRRGANGGGRPADPGRIARTGKPGDRLRAAELVGKQLGMFKEEARRGPTMEEIVLEAGRLRRSRLLEAPGIDVAAESADANGMEPQ